jgi:alpha-glucosidase
MHNRDALGYRGDFADPLYKSIPFIIKRNPETGVWLGLAITAPDIVQADFGVESQYYYSFTLRNGPYRYVVFTGDGYGEVLEKYTRFTGRPSFPPAFTFGFLGSSMDYVEPDDATDRVRDYIDVVEKHRIPCEGLYLSSGYYKQDNGHRHTFIWNRRKFPDPAGFIRSLRDRGFHVACNVKPGILVDHPEYDSLSRSGALVTDGESSVYREYYWGDNAAFWDFSSSTARDLWRERLRTRLIDYGVDGIWNDNNEYEIEDSSVPSYSCRSTFALRMAAAAWDELRQQAPERRPWVISRSGGVGIQRYARTWSGDNASTWESMRTNLWMGSSMGLSALPFFGHDIGGFFGKRPEPEQFLRWCQSAVFQPRFVVHSWNDDGKPTELWSYPELLPALRSLVLQHYEFMPYTYSHAYLAHTTGRPIQRLLSLEFPDDPELRDDEIAYLYGDAILVLPIVHAAAGTETSRGTVRLPAGTAWYDPENLRLVPGGQEFHFKVRPDRARYLLRTGSVVFHAPGAVSAETGWFPDPVLDIYPPVTGSSRVEGGSYDTTFFEDDGSTRLELKRYREILVSLKEWNEQNGDFVLELRRRDDTGWAPPEDRTLLLRLPSGFTFEDGSEENSLSFGREFSGARFTIRGGYVSEKDS